MDVLKWLADGLLVHQGFGVNGKIACADLCCLSYSYWWVDEANTEMDTLDDDSAQSALEVV